LKQLLLLITTTLTLTANSYEARISPITTEVKARMLKGNSWKKSCPVPLKDLRYLQIKHWNFKGETKMGELIVHKDVAQSIVNVFKELYAIRYPIRKMRLVSDFKGNDWQSIEADNTSALNCRPVTGNKKKWSNHAYGKAIDINPIENPYISRTGYISHKASAPFRKRKHTYKGTADKAMIIHGDKALKIFQKYGWSWGGEWSPVKDYQHFEFVRK